MFTFSIVFANKSPGSCEENAGIIHARLIVVAEAAMDVAVNGVREKRDLQTAQFE
jgi:hypothetical protein